jgi:hypothetical protein
MGLETESFDTEKPDDNKLQLLMKFSTYFYESQSRMINNAITMAGILITANGLILLASVNLIQFTFQRSANLLTWYDPFIFCVVVCAMLSLLSIMSLIGFISVIQPFPFLLSLFTEQLKNEDKLHLHDIFNKFVTDYSNSHYDKFVWARTRMDIPAIVLFTVSIMFLFLSIAFSLKLQLPPP